MVFPKPKGGDFKGKPNQGFFPKQSTSNKKNGFSPAKPPHPESESAKRSKDVVAPSHTLDHAPPQPDDDLTLDDVLAFGGTQEDFDLLKDLDDQKDEFLGTDAALDAAFSAELGSFISSLGFDKIKPFEDLDDQDVEEDDDEKPTPADSKEKSKEKSKQSPKDASKEKLLKGEVQAMVAKLNINPAKNAPIPVTTMLSESLVVEAPPVIVGGLDVDYSSDRVAKIKKKLHSQWPVMGTTMLLETSIKLREDDTNFLSKEMPRDDFDRVKSIATALLHNEVTNFQAEARKARDSESKMYAHIMAKGTLSDKLAAIELRMKEACLHHHQALETLVSMAKKKSTREALLAVETGVQVFTGSLLPDRKLIPLVLRPVLEHYPSSSEERVHWERTLVMWLYEDILKNAYKEFVLALQALTHDTVVNVRNKALGLVFDLLREKPEQEQLLLSILVNKLGDLDKKIASSAITFLSKLARAHPFMSIEIVREVERLLFRSHISFRAQYYALCFLMQVEIKQDQQDLANKLISIYFSFFTMMTQRQGKLALKNPRHLKDENKEQGLLTAGVELRERALSVVLCGLKRAFPYSTLSDDAFDKHVDTLFKMVHTTNFNCALQALALILQVLHGRKSISNRYYRALYDKVLDPALGQTAKQEMFINLVFRSLKADPIPTRVLAFIKRILQVCTSMPPGFVCGALIMVNELLKQRAELRTSLTQTFIADDDEEHFVDAPESDENDDESMTQNMSHIGSSDDENGADDEEPMKDEPSQSKSKEKQTHSTEYDPLKREPLFANAINAGFWELSLLAMHNHPSASKFAEAVLDSEPIVYSSDPLQDFTLINFLDRFVYKNAKKKKEGASDNFSVMARRKHPEMTQRAPVNSTNFVSQRPEKVRPEELFYYKYFKERQKKTERDEKLAADRKAKKEKKLKTLEELEEGEQLDLDAIALASSSEEESEGESDSENENLPSSKKAPKKASKKVSTKKSGSDEDDESLDGEALGGSSDDESEEEDISEGSEVSEDSEEEEERPVSGSKRRKKYDTFVDADEFSEILEANLEPQNRGQKKLEQWEERGMRSERGPKKKGLGSKR